MAGDKKVVIKINLPTSDNKDSSAGGRLREVSEWNIKRLVITGLILLLIFVGLLYMFLKSDTKQDEYVNTDNMQNELSIDEDKLISKVDHSDSIDTQDKILEVATIEAEESMPVDKSGNNGDNLARASQIIVPGAENNDINNPPKDANKDNKQVNQKKKQLINQWLVRSQLANTISNKEPVGEVSLPFVVNKSKARALFYFTELKNMKGKTVYHQWSHQGKTVFNRKINILGNRWRASTRKMISIDHLGNWNVRLLDDKHNTMAEITFTVVVDD